MASHANIPACTYWNGYLYYSTRFAALILTTLPYKGRTGDIRLTTQPLALGL